MKRLYLDGTAIKELPMIEYPSSLIELNLRGCSRLESLPSTICELKSLKYLYISGCSKLNRLPNDLGNLEALITLEAVNTAITEVPSSIIQLSKLRDLILQGCKGLVGLALPIVLGLHSLDFLDLSACQITDLPHSLGQLSSLKELYLSGNHFACIPASIENLSQLDTLDVSYCEKLQFLPKLPSMVEYVEAHNCISLEKIESCKLRQLESSGYWRTRMNFGNCYKMDLNSLIDYMEVLTKYHHKIDLQDVIFFPGNGIPDWFNNQNAAGSSVTIELPPLLHAGKYNQDLAVCVVLALQDHQEGGFNFDFYCQMIAKDKYGNKEEWFRDIFLEDIYLQKCVLGYDLTADHVLMGFIDRSLKTESIIDFSSDGITLTIEFYCERYTEIYEVKKCRVKLLDNPNVTERTGGAGGIQRRRFSSDLESEEEEEEPKPKRVKL